MSIARDALDNHGLIVGDGGMQLESGQRIHNHSDAQIYAGGDLQAQTGQAMLNEGRIGAHGDIRLETLAAEGRMDPRRQRVGNRRSEHGVVLAHRDLPFVDRPQCASRSQRAASSAK